MTVKTEKMERKKKHSNSITEQSDDDEDNKHARSIRTYK